MTQDRSIDVTSGWTKLPLNLGAIVGGGFLFACGLGLASMNSPVFGLIGILFLFIGCVVGVGGIVSTTGHFTVQPNQACVISLFGVYQGTVSNSGFYFVSPFMNRSKVSLRSRNFEGSKLKVNDKRGNPIEIAAVFMWHVSDAAKVCFDVEDYDNYVRIQSETALRHLANTFAYDHGEEHEVTLRSGMDEVSEALKSELQDRLNHVGVIVDEARLTHLAYAPEIAGVMLRRQQAEAIIAARQMIVHGAVSVVEMALKELDEKQIVAFDANHKAALVSNLLVVLCSEAEAQPVINAGGTHV